MQLDYKRVITGINEIKSAVTSLKSQLDKIGSNTGIPKLNKQIKQSSGFSKTLKGIAGIGTAVVTGRKMIKTLQGMTDESVNFVETANLFSVSMGKGLEGLNQYYERAVKFQNELQEKLGTNIEESMNYQALFNSMSKSMGISAKYAYILSENFTKLGYDLSSLYNIDPENAMQKLRAGLAGQTKPLRDLGLDITQQSLQPIVDSLGIERSVKNMSQAEKMVLRYIAVLKQAQIAQGDFANTMESPANQLRIFNAQVIAFKRNMGNLWQGLLGGVLPYVNAIMMVINELLKMVAKLFGFKVSDQKVNLSANIGADDLADDFDTASGKAKELKNQLMGFDEINNISLPSGSGGVSSGGIDQRLLDAMKEYDNLMNKVKGKATDIRDKIMQWLGFTKKINPLTGEISWEYTGLSKQAKTILGILKAIVALYIGAKILKLIGWLNTLRKVLIGSQTATTSFQAGLVLLGKGTKTTWTTLKLGVEQFKLYRQAGDNVTKSLTKTSSAILSLIPNTVKAAGGIAGLVGSSTLAYKSMKDLSEGTIDTNEAMWKLAGGVAGAIASGALIGSTFGPTGTVVGAIVGGASAIVSALLGYESEAEKSIKKTEEFRQSIQDSYDKMKEGNKIIEEKATEMNTEVANIERLKGKLTELVDENGNLKKGYEERASFILGELNEALGTEFKVEDLLKGKYQEVIGTIDNLIAKKKTNIIMTAFEEKYTDAMKRQADAVGNVETTLGNLQKAKDEIANSNYAEEIRELYGEWEKLDDNQKEAIGSFENYAKKIKDKAYWWDIKEPFTKNTAHIIENLSKQDTAYRQNEAVVNETTRDIINYNKSITLSEEGKTEELLLLFEEQKYGVKTANGEIEISYKNTISGINEQINRYKKYLEDKDETTRKSAEQEIKTQEKLLTEVREKLHQQALAVEEVTPKMAEGWKELADTSLAEYKKGLEGLTPTMQKEIQKATGVIINETNNAVPQVEKASDSIYNAITKDLNGDLTINFGLNADFSGLKKKLTRMKSAIDGMVNIPIVGSSFKSVQSNLNKLINQLTINGYENGGFPVNGEMFIARENGLPEMVGKIGNRTSVANNGQIIEGIKAGVYEAVMNANAQNGGTRVNLDVRADEGIIVKKASKGFAEYVEQTGELPFPVPV